MSKDGYTLDYRISYKVLVFDIAKLGRYLGWRMKDSFPVLNNPS